MDYNYCRSHGRRLSCVIPADFVRVGREAGCFRPHTPVLDGVQDCGIPETLV